MPDNIFSKAMNKHGKVENGAGDAVDGDLQDRQPRRRGLRIFLMVASIIVVGFFLVTSYFMFQLRAQLQAKDTQIAKLTRSQETLSRIEKTLESLSHEMTASSQEMVALRIDLQEALKSAKGTSANIAELEKQINVQNFNIANLIKAKDNIFGRVNSLSEKFQKIDKLLEPQG